MLFSDGIHNAAGDPVATARKLGVVVDAIGVGNSLRSSPSYRDVRVADLECPEQLPVNNLARITAHLGQSGLAGQVVKAVLEDDGKAADQADVVLRDGAGLQEVSFQFVPTTKGRHTYTVRVPTVPEEKIRENNQRSAVVQVVDNRIRVLYIEGTLRAEYGALVQRFLSKDPDLEFCALVQSRPNVFVQRTNMDGPEPEGPARRCGHAGEVRRHPAGRPGQHALEARSRWSSWSSGCATEPGCWPWAAIAAWDPEVTAGRRCRRSCRCSPGDRDIGQITDPFLPVLTPAGRDHPIFSNIGKFFPTQTSPPQVAGLPPLDGCVRVKGIRPGGLVLAVHPGEGGRMPVLAVESGG